MEARIVHDPQPTVVAAILSGLVGGPGIRENKVLVAPVAHDTFVLFAGALLSLNRASDPQHQNGVSKKTDRRNGGSLSHKTPLSSECRSN